MPYDIEKMTKAELIQWIRGASFYTGSGPRTSDVLTMRWQAGCKLVDARAKRNEFPAGAAEQDRLARKFNASTYVDERLDLIKRMQPFNKKLDAYLKESDRLRKKERRVDRLWAQAQEYRRMGD